MSDVDVIEATTPEYKEALEKLPAFQNVFAQLVQHVNRGGPPFDLKFRDADYYKNECDTGYQMIGGGIITRDDFRGGEYFVIDMQMEHNPKQAAEYRVSFLVMDDDTGACHNNDDTLATEHRFYVPLATVDQIPTWRADLSVSGEREDLAWRLKNWQPLDYSSEEFNHESNVTSIVAIMYDVMGRMMFKYLYSDAQMKFNPEYRERMALHERVREITARIKEKETSPSPAAPAPQSPRRARFFSLFREPR